MNKKLTARVQKIQPKQPESANIFSNIVIVKPDDENVLSKKGEIYSVFSISGPTAFDASLVTNIVHDVLQSSYYQSENISPIQSLEKAIVDVKDRVSKLGVGEGETRGAGVEFSMLAGVLWGNVLYVVQHGKAQGHIMRREKIKPINAVTEGSFSAASGVVKNEDVVIFSTKTFANEYQPRDLLKVPLDSFENLPADASCLMIKFIVESSLTDEEQIDFGLEKKPSASIKNLASMLKNKFKARKPMKERVQDQGVLTIQDRRKSRVNVVKFIIPAAAILLAASIVYTIATRKEHGGETKGATAPIKPAETDQREAEKNVEDNAEGATEPFYDIRISDEDANPTEIVLVENRLVAVDTESGKIYSSSLGTPKFEPLDISFIGISQPAEKDGFLHFIDDENYKIFDLESEEVTTSYPLNKPGVFSQYLDFIYKIDGDKLTKYADEDEELEESLWSQSDELLNAKDMSISVSIYVLGEDGSVSKYTSGTKDDFSVTGLEIPLINASKIVTDVDFENLYIADRGNGRIVAIDKEGAFVKELKNENAPWTDIRSFDVTSDESTLYILNGSRILEIEL